MFGPTDNGWIKREINLMNGRTEKEEIQLFRLTLGQCKINSRWPTWLLLPRCKDGLISLEITIFSLTFRRFSGDVEAAGGRLTSYLFSPFRSWRKTFNSPHSRLAIFPFVFLGPAVREGERQRETSLDLWGKGDFFFPLKQRASIDWTATIDGSATIVR